MARIVTSGWRVTPVHLDPYEFRHVGRLIVVRCPRAYDEVMSNVGGEWDPHHWRWLLHAPAKRRRPEGGLMNRRLTTMMQILASALWGTTLIRIVTSAYRYKRPPRRRKAVG